VTTREGQSELQNVLLGVAYCLPDVSYCQGMNFIAAVLIAVMDSEEKAFLVFVHLILHRELRPLFLPVSFPFLTRIFLGRSRAAPEELPNGAADQVPLAKLFRVPAQDRPHRRLLHFQVVHDAICLLSAFRSTPAYFRHVFG
jgi:hypothetical protein